nr:MAG: hypothetical protein [Totiviridae sp.]
MFCSILINSSGHPRSTCYAFSGKRDFSYCSHYFFLISYFESHCTCCLQCFNDRQGLKPVTNFNTLLETTILSFTWSVPRCLKKSRMEPEQLRPIIVDLIYSRSTEESYTTLIK